MKPDEFAAILIEKLEGVKREQEAQEKLDRKLQEVGGGIFHMASGSAEGGLQAPVGSKDGSVKCQQFRI